MQVWHIWVWLMGDYNSLATLFFPNFFGFCNIVQLFEFLPANYN